MALCVWVVDAPRGRGVFSAGRLPSASLTSVQELTSSKEAWVWGQQEWGVRAVYVGSPVPPPRGVLS